MRPGRSDAAVTSRPDASDGRRYLGPLSGRAGIGPYLCMLAMTAWAMVLAKEGNEALAVMCALLAVPRGVAACADGKGPATPRRVGVRRRRGADCRAGWTRDARRPRRSTSTPEARSRSRSSPRRASRSRSVCTGFASSSPRCSRGRGVFAIRLRGISASQPRRRRDSFPRNIHATGLLPHRRGWAACIWAERSTRATSS